MPLQKHFCWTRFGTEAGEGIDRILARKEKERQANKGVFLWGIGNAIGPSIRELVRRESRPEVVFSPIRSAPRKEDVAPEALVVWTAGRTLGREVCELPGGSVVTSRAAPDRAPHRHYALVCASPRTLCVEANAEAFSIGSLRNLLTDKPVGASQVTAVVQLARVGGEISVARYTAAIRAQLVFPYLIELTDPLPVPLAPDISSDSYERYVTLLEFIRRHRHDRNYRSPAANLCLAL